MPYNIYIELDDQQITLLYKNFNIVDGGTPETKEKQLKVALIDIFTNAKYVPFASLNKSDG